MLIIQTSRRHTGFLKRKNRHCKQVTEELYREDFSVSEKSVDTKVDLKEDQKKLELC